MKAIVNGFMDRLRGSESGFTLIEMLIVVGIIVALAAAIVPQVVSFGGKGEEGEKASERSTVQLAMDTMLADVGGTAVTAEATTARNDWTAYPTGGSKIVTLSPDYMPVTSTKWFYCWNTKASVTEQKDTASAC
jgi:prepilin-type N-terminal cleavage/methylation domain-containing protein